MSDPVDDFLEQRKQRAATRKQNEVKLWDNWKTAPAEERPQHLVPLLKAYEPLFNNKVREWKPPRVPESAYRSMLQTHFIKALEVYDPAKAALSTHIERRLQKVKRDANKVQNLAYIPEGQVKHIGPIQTATNTLTEELGRAPTHDEIADHLGMPVRQVATVLQRVRKDIPASHWESDPTEQSQGREREVLELLPFSLTQKENQVFEYLYGRNGKPTITSTNELAKTLSLSAPQVSRLRTSILNKYKQNL